MKRHACWILLLAATWIVGAAGTAVAEPTGTKEMAPPKSGPETAAVLSLFGHGATWDGQVPAGALGPNAPATTSHGRAVCGPAVDGFWCRCEIEDRMGEGKNAKTWRGHMVVGYDVPSKAYRAFIADNTGAFQVFDGTMEGNTLTLTTPQPISFMGMMLRDRLTFVGGPDGVIASFKDEHQVGDGPWMPFETVAHMTPLGAERAHATPAGKTKTK
ncbi:MAG: DUF1579 family protein [Hyphomicrobiales bacterium]